MSSETFTVTFTKDHLHVLIPALEAYNRARLGQLKYTLQALFPEYPIPHKDLDALEQSIRTTINDSAGAKIKFPTDPSCYFGITQAEVGLKGQMAYEIMQSLRQYKAVQDNNGYWKSGNTSFHDPLAVSTIPLPIIHNFPDYLDLKLSLDDSRQLHNYVSAKQWTTAWDFIKSISPNYNFPKSWESRSIGSAVLAQDFIDGSTPTTDTPISESYYIRFVKPTN